MPGSERPRGACFCEGPSLPDGLEVEAEGAQIQDHQLTVVSIHHQQVADDPIGSQAFNGSTRQLVVQSPILQPQHVLQIEEQKALRVERINTLYQPDFGNAEQNEANMLEALERVCRRGPPVGSWTSATTI